jgi:hypothetical protein
VAVGRGTEVLLVPTVAVRRQMECFADFADIASGARD